jgi:hypothetical protein
MEQSINLTIIKLIGYVSSLMTVFLWFIFTFINPYAEFSNHNSIIITIMMLLLPAGLLAIGVFLNRSLLMLLAFIWSFPYSLYMLLTPGIFMLFGITSFMYLLCFVLFRMNMIRY